MFTKTHISKLLFTTTLVTTCLITACSNQVDEQQAQKQQKQQEKQAQAKQQAEQTDSQQIAAQPPESPQNIAELKLQNTEIAPAPHTVKYKRSRQLHDIAKGQTAPYLRFEPPIELQQQENYQQEPLNNVYTTAQNPVSTFSIDVDTASYTNVRRLLNMGQWPQQGAVRIEEMVNYFDYGYQAPKDIDTPFSVHTEVAPSPWNSTTQLLKIGLQGYQIDNQELPPLNLVFLIDVSGSMRDSNKLPLLKRAFNVLTKQLRQQDSIAIVTYAGSSGLVLEPTAGNEQQTIINALDRLSAGGSTNGGAGIQQAYQTAKQNFKKDGVNRVILASDGDFNVGLTNMTELEQLVKNKRESGINLTILGFGQGNYNDHLTEKLSNIGNGNAYYIDNFNQARKVFADDLTGTLQTIAKDVKIQVEFNPAYVSEYRLVGYDNRKLNNEDFKNDKIDAGDIGAGHNVTAFYEITLTKDGHHFNEPMRYQGNQTQHQNNNDELAFVKLRYKAPNGTKSKMISQAVKFSQIKPKFEQASKAFQFATAVVGFAEQLRQSPYVEWSFNDITAVAKNNLGNDTWGYRREFMQLANNAKALKME